MDEERATVLEELEPLRELPAWPQKGERGLPRLVDWIIRNRLSTDDVEAVVDGLMATQSKTLKGYLDYCAAFKKHYRMGYHKREQPAKSQPRY